MHRTVYQTGLLLWGVSFATRTHPHSQRLGAWRSKQTAPLTYGNLDVVLQCQTGPWVDVGGQCLKESTHNKARNEHDEHT